MRKGIIILLLIGLVSNTFAMRCQGKLILPGMYVHTMIKLCGAPLAIYSEVVYTREGVAKKDTYIYEKYGREQRIIVIGGVIKGDE